MITDGTSPFGILGVFALVGGTLVTGTPLVISLIAGHPRSVRCFGAALLLGWAGYASLLLLVSLTSRERVLEHGQEKHICEIDCHTGYTVVGARTATTWDGRTARGRFTIVTLRVRFDSATISPHRGMAPLTPGERVVEVVTADGRRYRPVPDPTAIPFTRALIPGESYATTLVFDLPVEAPEPRLVVQVAVGFPDRLIIGGENSLLHAKTVFRLGD